MRLTVADTGVSAAITARDAHGDALNGRVLQGGGDGMDETDGYPLAGKCGPIIAVGDKPATRQYRAHTVGGIWMGNAADRLNPARLIASSNVDIHRAPGANDAAMSMSWVVSP